MTIGAVIAGFLGDRFGRRFTYQFNLLVFGLASFAAAFAPSMDWLIAARFVMGLGLGAEIVVGYSTMTEFVPPTSRGRWMAFMAFLVVAGFPGHRALGYLVIPTFGWRPMFVIAGVGALIVWYLRKNLPESPRWLESRAATAEAEALMQAIETRGVGRRAAAAAGGCRADRPVADLRLAVQSRRCCRGMVVGCGRADHDQHADLRLRELAAALLPRSRASSIAKSLAYTLVLAGGSLVGCALGAYRADRFGRQADASSARPASPSSPAAIYPVHAVRSGDAAQRRLRADRRDLCADRRAFGVYTPELFPTEVRLRANGICNTLGRGATVVSPFIVAGAVRELRRRRRDRADDRPAGHPDRRRGDLGHRAQPSRPGRARGCRAATGIGMSKRDQAFDGAQS